MTTTHYLWAPGEGLTSTGFRPIGVDAVEVTGYAEGDPVAREVMTRTAARAHWAHLVELGHLTA